MNKNTKKALNAVGGTVGSIARTVLKVLGTFLLVGVTTGMILACIFAVYVTRYLDPELDVQLDNFSLDLTSFVYYKDPDTGMDVEMATLHGTENRVWADYDIIPQHLKDAAVAIEDKRFWRHQGVDWRRTGGAFMNMFLSMSSTYGGSTITQQLIKNLTNDKEVTVQRKLQEIMRALEFEKLYDKEVILEWYLNTIHFGSGCDGVQTAALHYFGKDVSQLSLAESASLVGITNAPTMYNPYLNPDKNKTRQETILAEMLDQGLITQVQHDAAVNETLVFSRSSSESTETTYQSYYVDQVINDVIADLMEQKDVSEQMATRMIYGGGYNIYTLMDLDVQNTMDEIFQNEENYPTVKGSELPQASMMVVDPYTGDILGMIGGRGEKVGNRSLNRATQTYRQPGSSIKPITVYAPAMDMGLITPISVLDDSPLRLGSTGRPYPQNYDFRYRGRMTVIDAVKISANTLPVRLVNLMTPQRSFDFAVQNLGVSSFIVSRQVGDKITTDIDLAPMALGGLTKGISVRDLTGAYTAFVNHGYYTEPRTYSKVVDSEGTTVLDNPSNTSVAMKEKTAYYMTSMLQEAVRSGTATPAQMSGMPSAGKTGTTTNDHDRWFVGYTPYYVAAVWFGFDDPQEIQLTRTRNPALAMWKLVMDRLHEGLERQEFFTPSNLVSASYCKDSGMAPTELCRLDPRGNRIGTTLLDKGDVPTQACTVHTAVTIDSETGQRATPYCPVDSLLQIALLNIDRSDRVQGVSLEDDAYVYQAIESGTQGSGSGYNHYCTMHDENYVPSPSGGDIDNSFPPDLPTDDPWASPSPSIPPSPSPDDLPSVPPADVSGDDLSPPPDVTTAF